MDASLIGLVMCGGRSTRMGTDKGLINHKGKCWSVIAEEKLLFLGIPVYISVNKDQTALYETLFQGTKLIVDDSNVPGPLGGLMTAHKQHPAKNIFALACDLLLISESIIHKIFQSYLLDKNLNHVSILSSRPEPMAAIYSSARLAEVQLLEKCGSLKSFSLKEVLSFPSTKTLDLNNDENFNFINFNTSEDIRLNK